MMHSSDCYRIAIFPYTMPTYKKSTHIFIIAFIVILGSVFAYGSWYSGALYIPKNLKPIDPEQYRTANPSELFSLKIPSSCLEEGETPAGGDKESKNMLVGQEIWESTYLAYNGEDFKKMLPEFIQKKLGVINNKTNCFFTAMNYFTPFNVEYIMKNTEFASQLKTNFCELDENARIQFGDIITVSAPAEKDNFHHAAIILNKNFILDKPDAGKSAIRMTNMQTLFDEWGKFNSPQWYCPSPEWPEGHKCIHFRFWRFTGK